MNTMTPMNKTFATVFIVAALSMTPAVSAQADSHMKTDDVTIDEVQQSFARAADKVQAYTVDQRDDALKAAREAIDVAGAEVRRMEDKFDAQWDKMTQAARKDARQAMREMNQQQNTMERWYGSLSSSSGDAWDEIKTGFSKAFDNMAGAMNRAQAEFNDDEG